MDGVARQAWRSALADWVASDRNPLTARVIVNRVWQWHFGQGLVRTPNDFGTRGERPTHPELLDWLAVDFMEHGWSLKHLHRRIMLSNAYQMSSRGRAPRCSGSTRTIDCWPGSSPDAWRPRWSGTRCGRRPGRSTGRCTGCRSCRRSTPAS